MLACDNYLFVLIREHETVPNVILDTSLYLILLQCCSITEYMCSSVHVHVYLNCYTCTDGMIWEVDSETRTISEHSDIDLRGKVHAPCTCTHHTMSFTSLVSCPTFMSTVMYSTYMYTYMFEI